MATHYDIGMVDAAGMMTSTKDVDSFGSYNLMGISGVKINVVKGKIEEYIKSVDEVLNKISLISTTEYMTALKGHSQISTIKAYVDSSITEIKTITNYLTQFNTALDKVRQNYITQSTNITTNTVQSNSEGLSDNMTGVQGFGE